jgi:two-component system response regulator YesN
MKQLLIVDDERIAIEGIKSGVRWSDVGIGRLLEAQSAEQAKAVFRQERVDLMLCDIEMPQGTGLELLEWVREHYPATETIFLTCHADFGYAKQAIQLGSLDYLLKPIPYPELEDAIRRAIVKLDEHKRLNEFSQYGKYWVRHQPLLVERFWLDILGQNITGTAEAIGRAAAERNIPFSDEMTFLPVFIHIRRWYKAITSRDEKIMEYAVRKSAEEVLLLSPEHGVLLTVGKGEFLVMLNGESRQAAAEALKEACERFVDACLMYFFAGVACYIGEPAQGHGMASAFTKLRKLDENNVAHDHGVFAMRDPDAFPIGHLPPDMGVWSVLLEEGDRDKLLQRVEQYMGMQVTSNHLNPELLNRFIQDFHQMIYYVMQVKGVQAHQLFGDSESTELHMSATRSATDALAWIRHIVDKVLPFVAERQQSVVDKAKTYIRERLAEDISREDIAGHVYLNPDYLTRVFKKETGLSVSDYLMQQRLGLAAELLSSTDLPVGTIAAKVGYANFSHFSRMFKKHTGLGPVEFRGREHGSG